VFFCIVHTHFTSKTLPSLLSSDRSIFLEICLCSTLTSLSSLFQFFLILVSTAASFLVLFSSFWMLTITSASASASFLISLYLPFIRLLRWSIDTLIEYFMEYFALWHLSFSIRHRLINFILELAHVRACQSRILPKPFIKLFLVGASEAYLIQLFFWKIVEPLIQINWKPILFMVGYIQWLNGNLSARSKSVY
jgi:hypothetical protein